MEVRGGCGYIEEWSDARIFRDAHPGSIWEGTSNIVALGVARAASRAGAGHALAGDLRELLRDVEKPQSGQLETLPARAVTLPEQAADGAEAEMRRAATALYDVTSAVFLAWEGTRIDGPLSRDRMRLAEMVVTHRLSVVYLLAPAAADPDWLGGGLIRSGIDTDARRCSSPAARSRPAGAASSGTRCRGRW